MQNSLISFTRGSRRFVVCSLIIFSFVGFTQYVAAAVSDTNLAPAVGDTQTNVFNNNANNSGGTGQSVTLQNPLGNKSIVNLFNDLVDIVLVFAVPIIVFFIIYAGFLYVTARGNTEQITQASRSLLYAIIGGLLILGAKVLLLVIDGTITAIGA